jgi:hypothetical protein
VHQGEVEDRHVLVDHDVVEQLGLDGSAQQSPDLVVTAHHVAPGQLDHRVDLIVGERRVQVAIAEGVVDQAADLVRAQCPGRPDRVEHGRSVAGRIAAPSRRTRCRSPPAGL